MKNKYIYGFTGYVSNSPGFYITRECDIDSSEIALFDYAVVASSGNGTYPSTNNQDIINNEYLIFHHNSAHSFTVTVKKDCEMIRGNGSKTSISAGTISNYSTFYTELISACGGGIFYLVFDK